MPKFTEQELLSLRSNSNVLNLRAEQVRDASLMGIIDFLDSHPEIKTVNLSSNEINDDGAKALASNLVLQRIEADNNKLNKVGYCTLNEKNSCKRASHGREV